MPTIRPRGILGSLGAFCSVTIDGTTQPGGLVELDGSTAGPDPDGSPLDGLVLTGRGMVVRGLVINRFDRHGIHIRPSGVVCLAGGMPNVIEGNFIGTDPTGMLRLGNDEDGVRISGGPDPSIVVRDNLIGGMAGGSNVISGNGFHGVHIEGASFENLVRSNFIGTDVTGSAPLPNGLSGVCMRGGASSNTIGGPVTLPLIPPGNTIGGNDEHGIEIHGPETTDNLVEGNIIGGLVGNRLHGVLIHGGANNNVIGDRAARDPKKSNRISNNGGDGVRILGGAGATGNWISINSIFGNGGLGIDGNGGLGIDLGGDGVTPNDGGDGDAGPNTLQNFPELVLALPDGTVIGTLNSTPATVFALDFYSNIVCNPSGFGEGQTFLGTLNPVKTDANGDADFTFTPSPAPPPSPMGPVITALAYDPASENFSEFSQCIAIIPPPTVVTVVSNQDSTLRPEAKDRNEGANPLLDLSQRRRLVVGFNLSGVDTNAVTRATLVLTINDETPPANWGPNGRTVDAHRLLEVWAEGNGKDIGLPNSESTLGTGPGVTWNCASDTAIENQQTNCAPKWNGGSFTATPTDSVLHTNGMTGEVAFDVTTDVVAGADSWLIKKTRGQGNVRYYSKDHPDAGGNPDLAPRLILELQ